MRAALEAALPVEVKVCGSAADAASPLIHLRLHSTPTANSEAYSRDVNFWVGAFVVVSRVLLSSSFPLHVDLYVVEIDSLLTFCVSLLLQRSAIPQNDVQRECEKKLDVLMHAPDALDTEKLVPPPSLCVLVTANHSDKDCVSGAKAVAKAVSICLKRAGYVSISQANSPVRQKP